MIQAIFFDIDGTLTDFSTHQIPSDVFTALHHLKEQGIRLFIATGRGPDGLFVLNHFPFDGYITLNGQYCYTGDGTVLYENTIEPESIRLLLKELKQNPVPCGFQLRDSRIFNFRNKLVDEIHAITQNDDAPAGDITDIDQNDIYQVMIFMDEAKACKLNALPYKAGFFISVPAPDPGAVCDKLHDDLIFAVPLKKGVRIAVCAVPIAKMHGMAEKIKKAQDALK